MLRLLNKSNIVIKIHGCLKCFLVHFWYISRQSVLIMCIFKELVMKRYININVSLLFHDIMVDYFLIKSWEIGVIAINSCWTNNIRVIFILGSEIFMVFYNWLECVYLFHQISIDVDNFNQVKSVYQ